MKRLLAVVLALAMVGGALYLRDRRDDDNGNGDENGSGSPPPAAEGPTRLVCATELADVCRGLTDVELTVEDASTTFDRLKAGTDPGLDAWLVFDPWPAMVDAERERVTLDPLFTDAVRPLGRSRIAAVGPDDLGLCDWRCLGERANLGELTLGLPDPTNGLGVVIVGAATAGYFGDPGVATNDFDPAFEDWLSTMVAGAVVDRSPVLTRLRERAFFDVALSTGSDAKSRFDTAAPDRKEGLALLYPDPVASVDVVLAGGTDALGDELAAPLLAAGWSAPDDTPTGLPNAGVLLALRERL